MIVGRIIRGTFGYCGKAGALGKGQILDIFSEIIIGRNLNAVGSVTHSYRIKIALDYCFLNIMVFNISRAHYLTHLTARTLRGIAGKVFDKLLCYCGAALI